MVGNNEWQTVKLEFNDGITTITLNRPEKKNAMNPKLHEEMCQVMELVETDALDPEGGTNVLILTGAGDSFSAGQDLQEYFLDNKDNPARMREVGGMAQQWGRALYQFPRATIAAVNGHCIGAAMRLLCSCDLAVASDQSTFALSEVNWGIIPGGGSTRLPAKVMGRRDYLYAALTGNEMSADEADKYRLVNKVVPSDALEEEVNALAEKINELNPTVVEYTKEVYNNEIKNNMDYEAAVDYELAKNRHLRQVINSEDLKAAQAFKDKKFKPGKETYSEEDLAEY